jgi:hypothetical protein
LRIPRIVIADSTPSWPERSDAGVDRLSVDRVLGFLLSSRRAFQCHRIRIVDEAVEDAVGGSRDSLYTPKSYKLVDLHDLLCDVKYEFNSDNRRLYAASMVLLQGHL